MSGKSAGQLAYEARWVAKGRRMGADPGVTDAEILAVIAVPWDELPAGMQADEEAGAAAAVTEQVELARRSRNALKAAVLKVINDLGGDIAADPGSVESQVKAAVRRKLEQAADV